MDDATARLLARSLRRALETAAPHEVESALADVGWREALRAEGTAVAALLFREQGGVNAASPAIDDLLLTAVGWPAGPDIAFVAPAFGRHEPPGLLARDRLSVRGVASSRMSTASDAIVVAHADAGPVAALVKAAHLRVAPVAGVDPSMGLVTVDGVDIDPQECAPVDWPRARAAGQVALSYELVGASRTMLRLAREHALARIQFGRPIAAFQVVRHRLADSLLAIETAEAMAIAALEASTLGPGPAPTLDEGADSASVLLASMAKALAGRGGRTVARHCQQVLAGVGFTAEHQFHRYFRRVLVLDGLFGDARTLTRELGDELIRTRQVPAAPPL